MNNTGNSAWQELRTDVERRGNHGPALAGIVSVRGRAAAIAEQLQRYGHPRVVDRLDDSQQGTGVDRRTRRRNRGRCMINGTKIRASKPRVATKQMRLAAPKVRADIYGTPQHREWSAEIIRRAGGICQGQGCPNPFEPGRLYADHVVELRDGGGFSLSNGQALCATCHGLKTSAVRAVRAARKY